MDRKFTYEELEQRVRDLEQKSGDSGMERELKKREARYRSLFEQSNDGIIIHQGGEIIDINSRLCEMSGYSKEQILGRPLFDPIPAEALNELKDEVDAALKGDPVQFETQARGADGRLTWVEFTHQLIDKEQKIGQAIVRDVSERKLAEKVSFESHHLIRAIIDAFPEPVALVRIDGTILACNRTWPIKNLGLKPDAVIGKKVFDLFPIEVQKLRSEKLNEVVRTGQPVHFYENLDGIHYHRHYYPLFDSEKRVDRIVTFSIDVTSQKKAEQALEESEARFRTLVEKIPAITYIRSIGETNITTYVSPQVERFLGFLSDEYVINTESWRQLLHPDDRDQVFGEMERMYRTFEPFSKEYRMIGKDGRVVWFRHEADFLKDEAGNPHTLQGILFDITERKEKGEIIEKRERELEIKKINLEEANTALKVLLKNREKDKSDVEEKFIVNIQKLVRPYIEKLKNSRLGDVQSAYLDILESNLQDIMDPMSSKLSHKYLNMTPSEVKVANLIKQGKTSRQIAALLDISSRTVEAHRNNIRRKLGLYKRKGNLRTYLLAPSED